MKRLLLAALAVCLAAAAVALSGGQKPATGDMEVRVEDRNPWSHLRLNNDRDEFRFAVVSDRTGAHRARVFSQAVEQLNLLQPEFVLSVGDLIEGYTEDKNRIAEEWREFQGYVCKLQMPFFYVPGNHDVTNAVMEKEWKERFGRRYYHFVYRDVLFLLLNSDDPHENKAKGGIGKEQIDYVARTLKENAAVRWTVVAMHRPLWDHPKAQSNGWLEVEKLLAGRNYTVFVGHEHHYRKFVRQGMNYYQLATTGGGSRMRGTRYGEFDHIVWVTMKKGGPVLANVMLDGIYPEDLRRRPTDEEGWVRPERKRCYPVRGKVYFEGCPAPDAEVVFHLPQPEKQKDKDKDKDTGKEKQKTIRAGDALAEADGSFVLSTYTAGDGAPVGEYKVTVVWRQPRYDALGRPGPNRLPERYASPTTTDLTAQVRTGPNEFNFNLTK